MCLRDLIHSCDSLDWKSTLYLPNISKPWAEITPCVIVEEGEEDYNQEVTDCIAKNKLEYAIGIQSVQDVIANAKQQEPNLEPDQLLKSLIYYCRNDAFLLLQPVRDLDKNSCEIESL